MTAVGVVAALPDEARALTGVRQVIANVHRKGDLYVMVSGMGANNAGAAAQRLVGGIGVQALVSWGTAGGLRPSLTPGDLVIPETILDPSETRVRTDEAWRMRLTQRLHGLVSTHNNTLVQTPQPLVTSTAKNALFEKTGASAVDMESAAIGNIAREQGVPFIAVRSIVDPHSLTLPACVLASMDEQGQTRLWRLMTHLALSPGQVINLIKLATGFRKALATLAQVARQTDFELAYRT